MKRIFFLLLISAALVLAPGTWGATHAAVASFQAGPVFTRGTQESPYPAFPDVQVQAEVPLGTDQKLLRPDAFKLSVDGADPIAASNVQTLASTGYGVAAAFALDVSGSMRGAPLEAVRTGLTKFVADAGPQDKIAIETIADDGRWDANWGDSRDQVRASLGKLAARGKFTRLWDALLVALERYPDTPLTRRLIVISDGHDEGSSHHLEEVIAAAHKNGVVIDAIGMTQSDPAYLQTLNRIATETGGMFRRARDTSELESLISHGEQRLKSAPVVSYHLDAVRADGNVHHFQVTWKHDAAVSMAETTATVPSDTVAAARGRRYWWIGGGPLVLLVAAVVYFSSRKRKHPPVFVQNSPAASASVPAPAPAPRPEPWRGPTVPQSASAGAAAAPTALQQPRELPVQTSSRQPAKRPVTEMLARFSTPSNEHPGAWLRCEQGSAAGKQYPVSHAEYWIGALDNNHLQIPDDPTVSGNHACLTFDHDLLSIYDHQSTNGTWVNDEQIRSTRKVLRPGDRIRIGQSKFSIETEGSGSVSI